jgi:hypothetical protein
MYVWGGLSVFSVCWVVLNATGTRRYFNLAMSIEPSKQLRIRRKFLTLAFASLVICSHTPIFAQDKIVHQIADASSPVSSGRKELRAITLDAAANKWGKGNFSDGTRGPWYVYQGIWNDLSHRYDGSNRNHPALTFRKGSKTVTGFTTTADLVPGQTIHVIHYSQIFPGTGYTSGQIATVGSKSIEMTTPAGATYAPETNVLFGLLPFQYSQTITYYPEIFPRETLITWSWPAMRNRAGVFSYPNVRYGGDGLMTGTPANTVPVLRVGNLADDFSVTFDIKFDVENSEAADCLIETYVTNSATPAKGMESYTNEVGVFIHVNNMPTILAEKNHFNFSYGNFYAYIATRSQTPPFTMIVPVATQSGTTPRDMTNSGAQTIPLAQIYAALVSRGIVNANHYIPGYQVGAETSYGSGSMKINELSFIWHEAH